MDNPNPTFSIIVPVYKVEAYLPQCLDSILGQSIPDFELILVDDGSTDSSGAICDQYARDDGRVRVIHKTNGGQSTARNAGLPCLSVTWGFRPRSVLEEAGAAVLIDSSEALRRAILGED